MGMKGFSLGTLLRLEAAAADMSREDPCGQRVVSFHGAMTAGVNGVLILLLYTRRVV